MRYPIIINRQIKKEMTKTSGKKDNSLNRFQTKTNIRQQPWQNSLFININ